MILNFTNLFLVYEKPRHINTYAHFITNEILSKSLEIRLKPTDIKVNTVLRWPALYLKAKLCSF